MRNVTRITLDVSWTPGEQSHPSRWDWDALLDTDGDSVNLYDSEEIYPFDS